MRETSLSRHFDRKISTYNLPKESPRNFRIPKIVLASQNIESQNRPINNICSVNQKLQKRKIKQSAGQGDPFTNFDFSEKKQSKVINQNPENKNKQFLRDRMRKYSKNVDRRRKTKGIDRKSIISKVITMSRVTNVFDSIIEEKKSKSID